MLFDFRSLRTDRHASRLAGLLLAGLLLLPAGAFSAGDPVQVKPPTAAVKVQKGRTVTVPVQVVIQKGWHIFGAEPLVEGAQGTRVTVAPVSGLTVAAARLPAPRRMMLAALKKEGNVYEGVVKVLLPVKAGTALGRHTLQGEFSFQACSEAQCMLPKKISFRVPIEVVK